jgi:hypothetical protein
MIFTAVDDGHQICRHKYFSYLIQQRTDFPNGAGMQRGDKQIETHFILKPEIYAAEESLRDINPKQ